MIIEYYNPVTKGVSGETLVCKTDTGRYRISVGSNIVELTPDQMESLAIRINTMLGQSFPICSSCNQDYTP